MNACSASVCPPPYWHSYQCSRAAKRVVHGVSLCTQHAKQAERPDDHVPLWPKGRLYSNGERSET